MFFSDTSPSSSSSSSLSSTSSPVHHASLVDPSTHSPVLLDLIQLEVSKQIIEYVVYSVAETVDYAKGHLSLPRGRAATHRPELADFATFVTNVLTRAEVTTPVVLASLAYIDRAKPHLRIALENWALERLFLGALIVASKYLNDSTLKNVHWALCTGVFGKRDVGLIEREFLNVLDWELNISEADVLAHYAGISAVLTPSPFHHFQSHHHHHHTSSHPHSHHQQSDLSRHHIRTHHRSSCPELEPSSPMSSDGTSSPQNPSTSNDFPESQIPSKGVPSQKSSSVHDIICSFPLYTHHTRPKCAVPNSLPDPYPIVA